MKILGINVSRVQKSIAAPHSNYWWNVTGPEGNYEISNDYYGYEKAYKSEVWVNRGINLISTCVASVPLKLYKYDKDSREEVTDHPVLDLLEDVNPLTMNASDLWRATVIALKVYGNCYWYLERKGGQEPKEIYWLKPSQVTIYGATSSDKFVEYYEYETGNANVSRIRYSPHDIIHFKYFNPSSEYYGMSPLSCVREAISADLYAEAWNKYFFKNSARPDGFFFVKDNLTDEQRQLMQKSIESQFKGVNKSHRIGVLEGGTDFKPIGATPKDAEWTELRKACRESILASLGVHPELVGASAANYATALESKKSFWEETVVPELKYYAEVLNWNLLPQFPNSESLSLEFDISNIEALQENTTQLYDRLSRACGAPFLTPNEARSVLGLEAIDGADNLLQPINLIPTGTKEE
jgi:HK97 family phage portal protein